MLTKDQKQARIVDLKKSIERAVTAIVATPRAMDVATSTAMRRKFRAQAVDFKLVKNTLARIAAKGTAVEKLTPLFDGPTALVFGYDDPMVPAKALAEFLREKPDRLEIRGGIVEGTAVDRKGVEELARMPGLAEARGMLLAAISSAPQQLAALLVQPGAHLVLALKARLEQLEKEAAEVPA